jgi:predicted nucleic acid-binding protein
MARRKTMILCDTNILIEFYKNNHKILEALRYIGLNQIPISSITQAELYYGAINKNELNKIKKHLGLLHTFPVDVARSNQFINPQDTPKS